MFNEKFWLAVIFISFIALVIKFFLPKIKNNLNSQVQEIELAVNSAKTQLEQAKQQLELSQEKLILIEKENIKLINEAKEAAENIIKQAKINAQNEYQKKISNIVDRFEQEQEQILTNLKKEIIIEAFKDVDLYLSLNLNSQQQKQLLEHGIEKLNKTTI